MEDIMDVIFTTRNGQYLDTWILLRNTHIPENGKRLTVNDSSAITENKIFDVIVKHDPR
jgi:hypothetical protein